MNNFAVDELARKDFFTCVGIWIAMEILCFWFLPAIKFIEPGDRLRAYFLTSLPLGIGGSLMSAASSRFLAIANDMDDRQRRGSRVLLGQLVGGIGLAGVMFPLIMALIEFVAKVQRQYQ